MEIFSFLFRYLLKNTLEYTIQFPELANIQLTFSKRKKNKFSPNLHVVSLERTRTTHDGKHKSTGQASFLFGFKRTDVFWIARLDEQQWTLSSPLDSWIQPVSFKRIL